jgi:hypothetical protein
MSFPLISNFGLDLFPSASFYEVKRQCHEKQDVWSKVTEVVQIAALLDPLWEMMLIENTAVTVIFW